MSRRKAEGSFAEIEVQSGNETGVHADAINIMIRNLSVTLEELRLSEERFRDFAETASDWFWETGPDHRFTYLSERLADFGLSAAVRLGRRRWETADDVEEEPLKWQAHRAALDRHEAFRDFVYRVRVEDGGQRFVTVSGKPVFDEAGNFLGYRGGARDVTCRVLSDRALRQAKQEADQANQTKSLFLANMSHELRTPLNAIIGFSELIIAGLRNPNERDLQLAYIEDIYVSAQHLLEIVNDVLDMSRIEAGKFELHEESVALDETVGEVARLARAQSDRAGLSISLDIDPQLPPIWADERSLRQILLNLISNAIKFTPAGGGVTIGARCETNGDIRLWVTDNGIGIATENLAKVTQPFTQVENVYERRHHGSGLGLSLVRALSEIHGGSIEIDSRLGGGTTVTVRLPSQRVERAASG
ncbi:MAG: ATP-binding protein [Kiloniellales bacterium]